MSIPKWAYRFRGYLVTPPLIFAIIWFDWEIEEYFVWPLGISFFLLGVGVRIWAQQHLHYRLKVRKKLTVTGPYSFVRNPMYIGNIMIFLGATIVSELLWFVPITFFYCLGICSLVIRYEETHLLEKFGEPYRRYMEEVPRWVPRALHFKNIGLINEYLFQSILVELNSLVLLFPFILKEIIDKSIS